MMRRDRIKAFIEEHGHLAYLQFQAQMLGLNPNGSIPTGPNGKASFRESVRLGNGRELRVRRPHEFSLLALWEAMVGPKEDTLSYWMTQMGYVEQLVDVSESAVGTASFASATGQLVATRVIQEFDAFPGIGDALVETVPSSLRGERMVGFTGLQGPKEVLEGEPYEESTFREKYITTQESKKGRLLSVTEEAVALDQTGEVLRRAGMLGRRAAEEREITIVRGVADVNSGERVYRPQGTAEQLYAAGNNNLLATATPLNDWTDIDEALTYHAENQSDDREPDTGRAAQPIFLGPNLIVLVSQKLRLRAAHVVGAREVRSSQGSKEEIVGANPLNDLNIRVLSSPILDRAAAASADDQYDDSDDWFIGDFPGQFFWKEIWPIQTFRAPPQNEEQFTRDIIARFKIRYYGGINAQAHQLVVKVNAA